MNCATADLSPFHFSETEAWQPAHVQHLYRRLGYGATTEEIETALQERPELHVRRMLRDAARRCASANAALYASLQRHSSTNASQISHRGGMSSGVPANKRVMSPIR